MQLNRLRLGPRLTLGFGIVLILMLGMTGVSYRSLQQSEQRLEDSVEMQNRAAMASDWKGMTLLNISRAIAIAKSSNNEDLLAYFNPKIKATTETITGVQKELTARTDSDEGKALMTEIAVKRKAYIATRDEAMALKKAADNVAVASVIEKKMLPSSEDYVASIERYRQFDERIAAEQSASAKQQVAQALTLLIGLSVACLFIAGAFAWLITQSVTVPLRLAVSATASIAEGDLSRTVNSEGHDEVAELLRGVAAMQTSLRSLVGNVRSSTNSIATASAEIATGSEDLANRTEQTASSLQQTASSMEQLTGSVKQSADAARTANQLASSAASVAARGGAVVSQVVSTMGEINVSSKKIGDIVGVIDGIAFQTNILALNAAVEAARAGEQGRGFAVVAEEVRSLAHRSAAAAKEIKGLIDASVGKVESGARLVQDAGATMTEIVASVQRVSDVIGEITAASSEQSEGIGQVNTAVSQLDRMTQQNSALVEESAAAAESLKAQARSLAALVATFRFEPSAA